MNIFRRINPALAVIAMIAVIVALVIVLLPHGGKKYVVADFPKTIALYKGSDVKILGVHVGTVESVKPMGTFVRVKFSYDDKYAVPADAKAAVISPSIVGDRFIQLTPAYKGGPKLADNAHLGLKRTATPLELDTIFGNLNKLDIALGPEGANAPDENGVGALTRLLDNTARNFGGQGVKFNQTIKDLSKLTGTLADNKDELFGASAEVEKFIHTMAKNDSTVRDFAQSLASGSSMLSGDRKVLAQALDNLSVALTDVRGYVHHNRALLTKNISGLTKISNTLVKNRKNLEYILKVGPVALNNLALAYDPNVGALDTRMDIGDNVRQVTSNPSLLVCTLLGGLTNAKCPVAKSGANQRTAALTGRAHKSLPGYDPTLAGLVEVTR